LTLRSFLPKGARRTSQRRYSVRDQGTLDNLSTRLQALASQIVSCSPKADKAIADTKGRWSQRRKAIEETTRNSCVNFKSQRSMGPSLFVCGSRLRSFARSGQEDALNRDLSTHEARRRKLLSEWEDIRPVSTGKFRMRRRSLPIPSRSCPVEVTMAGNRDPLEQLLREVGGNLSAALEKLRSLEQISLPDSRSVAARERTR